MTASLDTGGLLFSVIKWTSSCALIAFRKSDLFFFSLFIFTPFEYPGQVSQFQRVRHLSISSTFSCLCNPWGQWDFLIAGLKVGSVGCTSGLTTIFQKTGSKVMEFSLPGSCLKQWK